MITEAGITAPGETAAPSRGRLRVLFVQQFVPRYDVILYDLLGRQFGYDLVVAADIENAHSLNQHDPSSTVYRAVHQRVLVEHGIMRMPGILKTVAGVKPDVVIVIGNPRFLALPFLLAIWRAQGIATATWGMFHSIGPMNPVSRMLYGAMAAVSQVSLIYAQRGADELLKVGISDRKIRVVTTGVDLTASEKAMAACSVEDVEAFRRAQGLDGKIVFLQVARLMPAKRTELLIESMSFVAREVPDAVLVLVGAGPEKSRLMQLAETRGLSQKVTFAEPTFDEDQLCRWFRIARAVVCGGLVGLMAHNAMAYGTPVIAHGDTLYQSSEGECILHGSTGLLYRREDVAQLTEMMLYASRHESEMREMGERGKQNAFGRYSMFAKAANFDQAIQELTKQEMAAS